MIGTDPSTVRSIAFVELRRRTRKMQDNVWQLVAFGLFALFMIPFLGVAVFGFFAFGSTINSDSLDSPLLLVRQGVVFAWVGIALFGGFRAYSLALEPDRLEGMLTTVSHRDLMAGVFLSEYAIWATLGVLFLLPTSAAFALGAGSPVAVPLIVGSGLLVALTALLTGFFGALIIRNMGVRSVLLTRLRTLFLALVGIAYISVFLTQAFDTILDPMYVVLGPTPVGWTADLMMIGTSNEVSSLRAIGAIAGGTVGIVVLGAAVQRLAQALWYADGVSVTHSYDPTSRRARWIEAVLPRGMAGVVLADWTRARRAPITLSYAMYPLFFLIWPTIGAIERGTIGPGFSLWILLSGIWVTGALFTLNILGHEGAVLPVSLLSVGPHRTLVGGHLVASVSIGVPVTLVATLVFAILGGHPLVSLVTLSSAIILLGVGAGMLAIGIGTVFPRFEEVTVTRSTEAVIPSMIAFGVYSMAVVLLALPVVIVHTGVGSWIAGAIGVGPMALQIGGTLFSGIAAILAGGASMWFAIARVREFDLNH